MRIFKYVILLLVGILWLEGCSSDFASFLFEKGLVKDDYRYGDLYRTANLAKFKELKPVCETPQAAKKRNIHLVLAGDSFVEADRIKADYFVANNFDGVRVDEVSELAIKNDSSAKVIIIETVERHFRERFAEPWKGVLAKDAETVNSKQQSTVNEKGLWDKLLDLDMPYSKERHESTLFGYDITMKFREWKAFINHKLFDRVDEGVALNKSEEHLLYHLPSKQGISSAFDPISEEEIQNLVLNVNATKAFYKAQGIETVLSIIPNKTSILGADLGEYNRLIERVQNHPDLEMTFIDMYAPLKNLGEQGYDKGDTHWSCAGKDYWINEVNKVLSLN